MLHIFICFTCHPILLLTGSLGLCPPFYFVIKRYEQAFRPGLCRSDSLMTVVHILTVGISWLDPYCLPRVQYCCYQFSCIVTDRVCGTLFPLLSPVQCFCCWCKFKLLCYAWVPPTIFSGIPFFGYIAHIQTTAHGTDFSNILIFVRFGIAFTVNLYCVAQAFCLLK